MFISILYGKNIILVNIIQYTIFERNQIIIKILFLDKPAIKKLKIAVLFRNAN